MPNYTAQNSGDLLFGSAQGSGKIGVAIRGCLHEPQIEVMRPGSGSKHRSTVHPSPCTVLREGWQLVICQTILYHTVIYHTIPCYTILYYTILYYTILYYTILYYTILYYTIPYYTILYHTIPYHTILYYTILKYTILYYIRLSWLILARVHGVPPAVRPKCAKSTPRAANSQSSLAASYVRLSHGCSEGHLNMCINIYLYVHKGV